MYDFEGHIPGTKMLGQGGSAEGVVASRSKHTNYVQTSLLKDLRWCDTEKLLSFFNPDYPSFRFFPQRAQISQRKDLFYLLRMILNRD